MSEGKTFLKRLSYLCAGLGCLLALGCGQGGTEIGNPNQPADVGPAPTGAEAQGNTPTVLEPTPSPSPQSLLLKDLQQEGEEAPAPQAVAEETEENS